VCKKPAASPAQADWAVVALLAAAVVVLVFSGGVGVWGCFGFEQATRRSRQGRAKKEGERAATAARRRAADARRHVDAGARPRAGRKIAFIYSFLFLPDADPVPPTANDMDASRGSPPTGPAADATTDHSAAAAKPTSRVLQTRWRPL
jgi:hypothetical protein